MGNTKDSSETIKKTIDGNAAAAHVAYAFSEVASIYPITPSSPMGELSDAWAAHGNKNLFGDTVQIIEMQSEAGASGTIHGSLTAGALTTTFTSSQGLLLMIPNMHKIAGELLPTVFHVAARSLAAQSLSIFGDHTDVMSVRNTGFALMSAASVQEVHDLGIVSHLATLETSIPFLNFFDGFRTSHEIQNVEVLSYDALKEFVNIDQVNAFKDRGIRPEQPFVKVGAQNPDVYFQGRETVNRFYEKAPAIIEKYMHHVEKKTGRAYNLFDYVGASDATTIIIAMGSACDTIEETVSYLTAKGKKVGAIKVRLYRPFSIKHLLEALPKTTEKIAVLDRTKEVGAVGEPLYTDIVSALKNTPESTFKDVTIIGGRYGLSSKEFNPSMVKAVFDHLDNDCFHDFTVGITDDVTHKSIPINEDIDTEADDIIRCKFWGLGSDGTVSASKNSIKIIGSATDLHAQGYFSYDSKKSEGTTISYLRFGKEKIKSPYIPTEFDFIALHNDSYIGKYDILEGIKEEGTFLINTKYSPNEIFCRLTETMQQTIINKNISFYCINAYDIADDVGLEHHINTVMQTAFFELSGILKPKQAIQLIKDAITKQFSSKGKDLVEMNTQAVDSAQNKLQKVTVPNACPTEHAPVIRKIADTESEFITSVIEPCVRLKGDSIPVSKMPIDGKVPLGTSSLEKRRVATSLPRWIPENCIQCNQCAFVCPHATIRAKQIDPNDLKEAPKTFRTITSTTKNERDLQFRIQVYVEDCVGCGNCAQVCPAKNKALIMTDAETERTPEQIKNTAFFDNLPDNITEGFPEQTVKGTQFRKPLFEFHGACKGCGETPYLKLLTQLFGDHMVIANATGCTSITGGTFPTVPYTTTKDGRGPAWANSLFEDNAEYGLGMRLGIDANRRLLKLSLEKLQNKSISTSLQENINDMLSHWNETGETAQKRAQDCIHAITAEQKKIDDKDTTSLFQTILSHTDYLTQKAVWIVGGDGWAYDIGFGGLDHVLSTGKNVNVLVLDTEVYSNTGGQSSKATPMGAVAKFAANGKATGKKDLGLMMMSYGYVYVASVSMGGNKQALTKAFYEAQQYDGPSLIIAQSPCIAHGFNMSQSIEEEKKATSVGYWPLYSYDPRKTKEDKDPFTLLSKPPTESYKDFLKGERRFSSLMTQYPECAQEIFERAEKEAHAHYKRLEAQKRPKQDTEK